MGLCYGRGVWFLFCFEIWSSLGVSSYDGNSFQDEDC